MRQKQTKNMAKRRISYKYEPGDEVWVISPNIT